MRRAPIVTNETWSRIRLHCFVSAFVQILKPIQKYGSQGAGRIGFVKVCIES